VLALLDQLEVEMTLGARPQALDLTRDPDRGKRFAEEDLDLLGELRDPVGADGVT
jgi:hypothetical protein